MSTLDAGNGRSWAGLALDRQEAARLLRAARRADAAEVEEIVDWVYHLMPARRPAIRLKVRQLLRQGDTESADAVLARALLAWPTDPSLTLLRARSSFQQAQFQAADAELRLVLAWRPDHHEALLLAAAVAEKLGEPDRAVEVLQRAARLHPDDSAIRLRLVEQLLKAGQSDAAWALLETLEDPPPLLVSRALRQQSRLLDAMDTLQAALGRTEGASERGALLAELISQLHQLGDLPRLQRAIEHVRPEDSDAWERAACALLAHGEIEQAHRRLVQAVAGPGDRRPALHALVVSAALTGRTACSEEALARLRHAPAGVNHREMATCWRHGLLGRLIRQQGDARIAGADPAQSILRPLLRRSLALLESPAAQTGPPSLIARRLRLGLLCRRFLDPRPRIAPPSAAAREAAHEQIAPAPAAAAPRRAA